MKIIQCWWQWSAAPFSPSGLQKARNAEKVKIENRRWSYFFSKLDPMLFGVFGPKLAKESPCGHQLVNSSIAFYHPPLLCVYCAYVYKCTSVNTRIHVYMYWRQLPLDLYLTGINICGASKLHCTVWRRNIRFPTKNGFCVGGDWLLKPTLTNSLTIKSSLKN